MAEKQWNRPGLIRPFNDWREGRAGLDDLKLLDKIATPTHINDLYTGIRSLLLLRNVGQEYRFSDGAMHHVRQAREAYLGDVTIPKFQLFLATVIRLPDGDSRVARMYNTRPSFDEVLKRHEIDPNALGDALELNRLETSPGYDTEQHINTFPEDMTQAPTGAIVRRYASSEQYPEGRTEKLDPVITIADYMTIGHMIEFDTQ